MQNPKPFQRRIAIVLLAIFLPSLFPVNMLYASNGSPTAPEATSFEPVDATDMVNLVTGDLSYVMPVLNVPSPEGGYPLSLAYHAGIAMDQEASWVGLGWNLNPGAINRSVNGVPDDWYQVKTNQVLYNAGGEVKSFSGSISVGWGDKGAYSVGLYAAYSENKTFGGTTSYNFEGGLTGSVGPLSGSIGSNGVGMNYGGASIGSNGVGFNYKGIEANQDFNNGNTSLSAKYSGVGVTWSSRGGYAMSFGSGSIGLSGSRSSSNEISTSTQSYSISIPIYAVNLGFGYSKTRYWSYQIEYTKHNGTLYAGDMLNLSNDLFRTQIAFDSYNSIYKLNGDKQLEEDNLSYVSYDNYSASGQGMSGSFKPHIFEHGSLINNYIGGTGSGAIVYFLNGGNNFTKRIDNNTIHFYFENDNSSFLKTTSGNWSTTGVSNIPVSNLSPQNQVLEYSLTSGSETNQGYNVNNKKKRTGTVIDSYTNQQIVDNPNLIIQPNNINRSSYPSEGVGAFKITAIDGKTYHYSLPVYQKEKFSLNTDLESEFKYSYLEIQQLESYATHWLVTAITGPDYIDNNQNNKVDEGDYGYWVEFDYGKWSNDFVWRTPEKLMEKAKVYEWGIKEIYYLDKIKTRTHTAIFVKSDRLDDSSYEFQVGKSENDMEWETSQTRSFIFDANGHGHVRGVFQNEYFTEITIYNAMYYLPKQFYGRYIKTNKHKSLKLDKIMLYKNDDFSSLTINKSAGNNVSNYNGKILLKDRIELFNMQAQFIGQRQNEYSRNLSGEFYNNVYDKNDISELVSEKAIKSIKFNYASSNLLAKNSVNSSATGGGRLTLDEVQFLGKNQAKIIPPYKFNYGKNLSYDSTKEDNWGYYENNSDNWSLTKISNPTGADINVSYESDDIDKEAVSSFRGFDDKLQFIFNQVSNKLRITVQNEYLTNKINFSDYFQVGTTTMDLWASNKHDYNDFGCESRKGSVDINSNSVEVVSVTNNSLVLEFSMASVYNDNGGFGWMSNKVIGLKNHPGMIRDLLRRGQWGEPGGCTGNLMDRLVLIYHLYGNKQDLLPNEKNSGGIRVKEMSLSVDNIVRSKTKYYYNVPGFGENKTDNNYKSSGITSFVPQKYFKEIKYRTELPSPTVMYEYVTVKNFSQNGELGISEQYNFEVLSKDLSNSDISLTINEVLHISKDQQNQVSGVTLNNETYNLNFSRYNIMDKTSKLGSLKEKRSMNSQGQNLSIVKNEFETVTSESGQGIYGEAFRNYKKVTSDNNNINYRLGSVSKLVFPHFLKKSTTTNNGYSTVTSYDKYDFLTGQVLETTSTTSDGKSYKTKIIPAYLKYPQMGSKVDDINNKNMLSQTAATYSYLSNAAGALQITGVGITTWNNEWLYQDHGGYITTTINDKEKIWRKHKSYTWNGTRDVNGFFSTAFTLPEDGFVWGVGLPQTNSRWKQTSEITLYDHYSKPLEVKDINNNKAATKMDVYNEKVEASGNAAYNEMYYSGGEIFKDWGYWIGQEVRNSDGQRTDTKAHTGKYSIATTSTSQFGVYMRNGHRPGKYKISVWVHKDNYLNARLRFFNNDPLNTFTFNGEKVYAGDWVLLNHYTDSNFMNNSNDFWYVNSADNTTVYFDDLMIRPIASSITGYVYNEYDELTHIIGNNGLATRFEYDAAGRLIKTYVEIADDPANNVIGGFKLKSQNRYNYKNL